MTRVVYVVTTPLTARTLLRGQLAFMREHGYEVTLIADGGPELEAAGLAEGVAVVPVSMERNMSPLRDLRSLFELYRTLRRIGPDIVNAGTMKAGLIGMLASFLAGVPVRIYVLRGLRLEGLDGPGRWVLRGCETIASACAHRVVCVSPSLRREYERLRVTASEKLRVLLSGSSNGIDVSRFEPTSARVASAHERRRALGIADDARVVGFVGRVTRDKGIEDLMRAFQVVRERGGKAVLLLVGAFDDTDPISTSCKRDITESDDVKLTGFVPDVATCYPMMDVLVLPSFREGFPNVPLEAAVARVPTVAYAATGTVDAVVDGETGRVVPKQDWRALGEAVANYLEHPELRRQHGERARTRATTLFRNDAIWKALAEQYEELLAQNVSAA